MSANIRSLLGPPPALHQGIGFAQGTAHREICKLGLGLHTVFLLSELKLPVCWSEAADGLGCGAHGPKCRPETLPPRFSAFLFFMRPVPGHHPVRGAFFFFALRRGPFFRAGLFSVTEIGRVKTGGQIQHTTVWRRWHGIPLLRTSYVFFFFCFFFWISCWICYSSWHRLIWWIYPRGCRMKQLCTV